MLLKPFACYATGVLTTALAVSMGCGHWGVISYAMGVISVLVGLAFVLSRKWGARCALAILRRIVGDPEPRAARSGASKPGKWVPPCQREEPREFVAFGNCRVAVDPQWQDARKLSKRKQWRYACDELAKLPIRKSELHCRPGTEAYEFLNTPELFG